jgi:DNA end-binding protein Ku
MASGATWKGYLKLSLVTCPVAMMPATSDSERLRFHTLNRATGHRVASRYVDAATGAVVEPEARVKGYQTGADTYVMLEEDELAAVALPSTRTIDIEMFVPRDSVGSIWYDTAHYLTPDDPVGEEAFGVIRAAMDATGTVGIARLVLYRRERAVLLAPRDRGIVLWTLRPGEAVRDAADYFAATAPEPSEPRLVAMVARLIDARTVPWDAEMVSDPVRDRLRDIIAARQRARRPSRPGRAPATADKPPPHKATLGNVVSITDALKRSLAESKGAKRS